MKYLNSLGIDSKIAQFSEIYCRQKENHQRWKFLKDFKQFAVGDCNVVDVDAEEVVGEKQGVVVVTEEEDSTKENKTCAV
jgi:hypothetical protein